MISIIAVIITALTGSHTGALTTMTTGTTETAVTTAIIGFTATVMMIISPKVDIWWCSWLYHW